jgi:hypothetical protein
MREQMSKDGGRFHASRMENASLRARRAQPFLLPVEPSEKYDTSINWTRSAVPFPKNMGAENREQFPLRAAMQDRPAHNDGETLR